MTAFWQRTQPKVRAVLYRLWRAIVDALSLLILSPFLMVGLLAGLFVTLLFWIGAALMIGYLAGRKNLDA